jgi:hypothetical protein
VGAGGGAGGRGASSFPIEEVAVASARPPFPDEAEAAVSGCVLRVVSPGLVAAFVGRSPASLVAGPAAAAFAVLVAGGVLVGAVGCHLPRPARIRLPHFVAFVLTFVTVAVFFFVALVVLLVVAVVVGLAFALLVVAVAAVAVAAVAVAAAAVAVAAVAVAAVAAVVAVALVVLVALVLAAVFALLFGPAWGYVRSALLCARQELGWGRWKETSSSRTRACWRCHANTTLVQQTFCPVFRSFVSKLE